MSGQAAVAPANIDSVFASTANEVYADQPFYGAIFRVGPNGEEVWLQHAPQKEKLTLSKFLSQKNISQGRFLIKQQADGGIKKIPFVVNKNADSDMINPFLANMPPANAAPAGETDKTIETSLKSEIERLKTNLQREEDKRRDAEDELSRLKRDGTTGNTEQAIAHQKEINRLEKQHAAEKEELKDELSDLKMDLKLAELENRQDSEGWEKVINKVLDGDILSNIAQNVGGMMQQQGNAQPTPAQLQAAMQQAGQGTGQQPTPNTEPQPHQPRTNPPADEAAGANNTGAQPNEARPQPQPQQKSKAQMKTDFVNGIKKVAIEALTAQNADLQVYANAVRQQMAINKQAGISLDAGEWVRLAKMLANKAIEKEISPKRVAAVINPVLDGVPAQYRGMLSLFDARNATNKLFSFFNVEASPEVKNMVVKVLEIIKTAK